MEISRCLGVLKTWLIAAALIIGAGAGRGQTYTLTVKNGMGGGSYAAGVVVDVAANPPATNQVFDHWSGATATLANPCVAATTFLMPATNVTITANIHAVNPGGWNVWAGFCDGVPSGQSTFAHLFVDATNCYYATMTRGVYSAPLNTHQFMLMPTNGLNLWTTANTNGLDVQDIITTPGGPVAVSCQVHVTGDATTNAVHYWFDATAGTWRPAVYYNKSNPFTFQAANLAVAPDGGLWSCSGFDSYAYHSTNGGMTYTALPINQLLPGNYFPTPLGGVTYVGKIFGVLAGDDGTIYIGSETGGFFKSTNNGANWFSLDPNFTNPNSTNGLGRTGNAGFGGIDRFGRIICISDEFTPGFPGEPAWEGLPFVNYDPATGLEGIASTGLPMVPSQCRMVRTAAGDNFVFLLQNTNASGGIFRSLDGANWAQFNQGITVLNPPIFGNLAGGCIAVSGNTVFVGTADGRIWSFDDTPPPGNFALSVNNGHGSGSYPADSVVNIAADDPGPGQTFRGWSGYPVENTNAPVTRIVMSATNVIVTANYAPAGNPASPQINSIQFNSGSLSLTAIATANHPWVLQDSVNLVNWSDVHTNISNTGGVLQYSVPVNPGVPREFFRIRSP